MAQGVRFWGVRFWVVKAWGVMAWSAACGRGPATSRRGCEGRGGRRGAGPRPEEDEKYRFDEAQRPAQSLSVSLPAGGAVDALPKPAPPGFPGAATNRVRGPTASPVCLPVHADGGRAWPATRSPDRPGIPPEPVPARPHPRAAKVAGRAPSPSPRGEDSIRRCASRASWRAPGQRFQGLRRGKRSGRGSLLTHSGAPAP